MKSTKAYIIGALIITISIMIIGGSLSYAYYMNTVQEENAANKGVSASSGELTINFTTSSTIQADAANLINDGEITTKADHTDFAIALPSSAKIAAATYKLYLTDLTITDNFKSTDLKWALYNDNTQVTAGNFSTAVTGTEYLLVDNLVMNRGESKNYKLYIWLSNSDDRNQISLLNGTLSAKVAFKAYSKAS